MLLYFIYVSALHLATKTIFLMFFSHSREVILYLLSAFQTLIEFLWVAVFQIKVSSRHRLSLGYSLIPNKKKLHCFADSFENALKFCDV